MNEDVLKPECSDTGRKRSRSETDESEECLPIAKRINNLQIRSRECSSDGYTQESISGPPHHNWDGDPLTSQQDKNGFHSMSNSTCHSVNNNNMFLGSVNHPVPCGSSQIAEQDLDQRLHANQTLPLGQIKDFIEEFKSDVDMDPYEPEMDDSTNPHYYSINQLLYYANFARQTRTKNGFKQ